MVSPVDRLKRWWGVHFLVAETAACCLAAALIAYWGTWGGGWPTISDLLDDNRGAFYGTSAALAGSLLGFVIAAFAITLGALDSARLALFRRSEHVRTLVRTFTAATIALGLATVLSMVGLLVDREKSQRPVAFYLVVVALLISASTLARSFWALHAVVRITTARSTARAGDE